MGTEGLYFLNCHKHISITVEEEDEQVCLSLSPAVILNPH